jgi:hypothetical protein
MAAPVPLMGAAVAAAAASITERRPSIATCTSVPYLSTQSSLELVPYLSTVTSFCSTMQNKHDLSNT